MLPYRLVPNMRNRERVLSILAIIGSFIGGCGLIFLSIFDTKVHPTAHRICLVIFIVGIALSAIFSIIEVLSLSATSYPSVLLYIYLPPVPPASEGLPRLYENKESLHCKGGHCHDINPSCDCLWHNTEGRTGCGRYGFLDQIYFTHSHFLSAAILEWIIAFGFTLYLLVFYYDLRMSKNIERGQLRGLAHPSQSTVMTEIS